MKKYILFIAATVFLTAGIFVFFSWDRIKPKGYGGLQITANIKASVFLDGKQIGTTPLCKCEQSDTIKEGIYDLKITPEDSSLSDFVYKVRVEKNVLTAVDRTFLPGAFASAYILNLEKTDSSTPWLLITSLPSGALVLVDGNQSGVTPYTVDNISASEHEIEVFKEGFAKKTIRIRAVPGYRLIANILLGTKVSEPENQQKESEKQATESAMIIITSTPTGFLRVREGPGLSYKEIYRVRPQEAYPLIEEENDWLKIRLTDGTLGWISSSYAQKTTAGKENK